MILDLHELLEGTKNENEEERLGKKKDYIENIFKMKAKKKNMWEKKQNDLTKINTLKSYLLSLS